MPSRGTASVLLKSFNLGKKNKDLTEWGNFSLHELLRNRLSRAGGGLTFIQVPVRKSNVGPVYLGGSKNSPGRF